jgi:hypothetical protein
MGWRINPEYKEIQGSPINPYHDVKTTKATIKELLKDGTPDWFTHPEDYKNFAKESYQADKEASDEMVLGYKMEDQELLTNYGARAVNIMSTAAFVKRLKDNGVKCFAIYNGLPQTVGLWVVVPGKTGTTVRYIAFMQVPAMIEWSVLRLNEHGLPDGEDYRGWRTVLSMLIRKEVITEAKAHEIFGHPTDSVVSRRYRQTLWTYRHRTENVTSKDGF